MLQPGRELDALVALEVFRYTLDYEFADTMGAPCVRELRDQYDEWGILPSYSTDMSDAWLVIAKLHASGKAIHVWHGSAPNSDNAPWYVQVDEPPNVYVECHGFSASYAICIAALKVCGVPLATPQTAERLPD